jgi:quercetin dioxygenase-like cupin family protein
MKFWDWNHIKAEEVTSSQWKKSLDADNLAVSMVELLEGARTPVQSHRTEHVILVLQGALRVRVRDEEVTLRASQMLSIPPHADYSSIALKTASFVTVSTTATAASGGPNETAPPASANFLDDASVLYDPDQYLWAV